MRGLVLLAVLAPLASASCPVTTHDEASGDCSSFGAGETSATVDAGLLTARAGGSSFCYTDPENGAFSSSTIFAEAAGTYAAWSGSTTGGSVYVVQGEDVRSVPAPVGPPNPGWGNLLP